MSDYMIDIHDLCKVYKHKMVINHLEMKVKKGDIYGFIGYNGAGKSTTLKMICGLVRPTSGTICCFGDEDKAYQYRRIGALIENAGLYPNLTARENLQLKAIGMGIHDPLMLTELLSLVGLEDSGKKHISSFSVGMKQRLGIAMALLGNPDLLILDEPINGLDPQGIKDIRLIIERLNKERGMTIIISSHILGELSKIASTYGIIKEGKMVEQITSEELNQKCSDYLEVQVDNPALAITVLEKTMKITNYEESDHGTILIYHDEKESGMISKAFIKADIMVNQMYYHKQDLEQYFLNLMGGETHA